MRQTALQRRAGVRWRAAAALLCHCLHAALDPTSALAASWGGTLTLRVLGLPASQRPAGLLSGPGLRPPLIAAALALAYPRPGVGCFDFSPQTVTVS